MDVGASLRHARMRNRLTLEQLARATKIKMSLLEALENNDFERLPPVVYTRGFLRSYAREVGLNADEIVNQYLAQLEDTPSMVFAEEQRMSNPSATMGPRHAEIRAGHAPHGDATVDAAGTSEPRGARVLLFNDRRVAVPAGAALLVVIMLGAYFGVAMRHRSNDAIANAQVQTAGAPAPAQAPQNNDAMRASNVTPDAVKLELKIIGPCWISASADRAPVLSRLFNAGEHQTLQAKDEVVLRVGDPSTVQIEVNGVPARPLGRARQPVTVQINKSNYRQFAAP